MKVVHMTKIGAEGSPVFYQAYLRRLYYINSCRCKIIVKHVSNHLPVFSLFLDGFFFIGPSSLKINSWPTLQDEVVIISETKQRTYMFYDSSKYQNYD
jgi:hypothetical protein